MNQLPFYIGQYKVVIKDPQPWCVKTIKISKLKKRRKEALVFKRGVMVVVKNGEALKDDINKIIYMNSNMYHQTKLAFEHREKMQARGIF